MTKTFDDSSEPQLPETPFLGVIASRKVVSYSDNRKVSLLILPAEPTPGEQPAVIIYEFEISSDADPSVHLRKGHKVRVKSVDGYENFVLATEITFDPSQFLTVAEK